ncbi:MAG TPA: hypothetical protein VM490_07715 [Armatimonadaceae bacterium]|nr:hypothetical protein [Armatimonadaceae bacterium]
MSIAALVLAGGKIGSDLEPVAEGATNRALIRLGGRPMLDYVLEATRGGRARRAAATSSSPTQSSRRRGAGSGSPR